MTWYHRPMARNEVNQDPIEGEFFAPEEGYAAALVRESIQNMLDNSAETGPVTARFALGRLDGAEDSLSESPYLRDLLPHLQALGVPFRPNAGEQIAYLVVEDFGTRGLCGDETQHADVEEEAGEPKNDFYYFWRNIGRSKKKTTDRGRWGLGKTVFPASSRVLAFFGLTKRFSDGRRLLMGQSVGKIHEISGEKFAPYGYFGAIEGDGFALPIDREDDLQAFERAFGLNRQTEAGLSVVVPFPHRELDRDSLLREVIRNYYLPILFGELTVVIEEGAAKTTIDHTTVVSLAAGLDAEIHQMIDFARTVLVMNPEERIHLSLSATNGPPNWGESSVFGEHNLGELRNRFDAGELLSLRVPVNVTVLETQQTRTSHFDAYLQRDPRLERGRGDFVRQGLTITRVDRPPRGAVRGLLLVNDAPLSALLGDSEGPAHTKWEERRERVKRYGYGSSTVRFVSRALQDLAETLSLQPAGLDEDALLDVFSLADPEMPGSSSKAPSPKKKGKTVSPPVIVPTIVRSPRRYDVRQIKGGFSVIGVADVVGSIDQLRVKVAYAVEDGNAQRNYHEFDFELDRAPISISAVSATFKATKNIIEITPEAPDFTVRVLGFDLQRDLEIDVKP